MSDVAPGVYFNLPDHQYHSIPALSATGIKNLLISPMDFWARSWMNPLREEEADSEARLIGKAYHKRVLEGKAAFDAAYAPTFTPDAECLRTIDDIKTALAGAGIEAKAKRKKEDFIALARDALPDALIYDVELAKYESANAGKAFVSERLIEKIEVSAAMIEKHPHLARCFTGGYPEVSVVWEEEGLPMKARFDYLKPRAIIDLKTFENRMNKPIDKAIYYAMASAKYHIQAAFYSMAFRKAQELIVAGLCDDPPPLEWGADLVQCEEHGFYFVFQQKGIAPVARGKKLPRGLVFGAGVAAIHDGIEAYRRCLKKFGTDPWIDDAEIDAFEDDQMPAFAMEL